MDNGIISETFNDPGPPELRLRMAWTAYEDGLMEFKIEVPEQYSIGGEGYPYWGEVDFSGRLVKYYPDKEYDFFVY